MNHNEILNGNELIIQGGLEAGIELFTGYPGSPLADFFNILFDKKDELHSLGVKVVLSNSEANAAAMASGAKMANKNVMVGMKSMGLHVASDALSVGNFANPGDSGVVIVVGDDPWSISTSTPADSRYLFKHLHIPFLEPSTPQEVKDWIKYALELSTQSSVYTGYLVTTFLAEGGGRVEMAPLVQHYDNNQELNPDEFNLSKNVMVPPNSLLADKEMILNRFPKVKEILKNLNLDLEFGSDLSSVGFISSGAVFETLRQVLHELGLEDKIHLYKAACSYPLNEDRLRVFLESKKVLIVVEEKRGFLENEIRELTTKLGLSLKIYGKELQGKELFPAYGGLSFEIIKNKLYLLNEIFAFEHSLCELYEVNHVEFSNLIPKRLPTFCPGCPHRETLSLLKDLRRSLKKDEVNLITHGDVGCYSLSFLEPFKEMHDLSAMGQGGAMGAGTDLFSKNNPSVVLMGDSTFFHSGMTAISNSVQLGHNITYILLDNDNTAMTGHQMTPASGISVDGDKRPRQKMLDVVRALKVSKALEVNPSDRYFYKNLISELVLLPGTKVIVSNKECALTYGAKVKKIEREYFASNKVQDQRTFYQINTDACEDCRECVELTGCPGLSQTFDAYGSKIKIDHQICVNDSYCTKIKACPSFEEVVVENYHPTLYRTKQNLIERLKLPQPESKISFEEILSGKDFRIVVIGVGGSGVTTISRVLAEAAHLMDKQIDFKFVDQKGLAQRNGSVSSYLAFFRKGKSQSPVPALASCDLVLSPDLLEGGRALGYLSKTGKAIFDSEYQIPLTMILERGIDYSEYSQKELEEKLSNRLKEQLLARPFKTHSFNSFSRPVYASIMILGAAFQSGMLPFSENDLKRAIERTVSKQELKNNLDAFEIGRELFLSSKTKITQSTTIPLDVFQQSINESLFFWQNKKRFSGRFINEVKRFFRSFPFFSQEIWAQYLHDQFIFDYGKSIENFYSDVQFIDQHYLNESLKQQAVRILAKTYFIKDEVFVAHQLISPLKKQKDMSYYSQFGSSYRVGHINRPSFDFGKRVFEFDLNPKDWMLKRMRKLRFLRLILSQWHHQEKMISSNIRKEILSVIDEKRLKELETVKGYRQVRYAKAQKVGIR